MAFFDQQATHFVTQFRFGLLLGSFVSGKGSLPSPLGLAHTRRRFVLLGSLDSVDTRFESLGVLLLSHHDALVDKSSRCLNGLLLITRERLLLGHEPGQHVLMEVALKLGVEHAESMQSLQSALFEADQVFLRNDARNVLLVGALALQLPGFLLVGPAFLFSLDAGFGRFESLGLNQLCIPHLLVLLLLRLHNCKFGLLEDFHAGLLKCLHAEHVEHGLHFRVKVKQLSIALQNLSLFAVLLCRHLRLEQWHWRSVEIEFRSDADLFGGRLVRQILNILVCLNAVVHPAVHWLR